MWPRQDVTLSVKPHHSTLANKSTMHGMYSSFQSFMTVNLPLIGLVPYDGDDSQSESEATHDNKARRTAASENDNVRVTISGLTVAVSLWLAVPPFASGLRAKVRQ